jgi:hypothetical protein
MHGIKLGGVRLKMAKVADIDLELFESGQGSPLLFLHGGEGFDQRQPFAVAPGLRQVALAGVAR